MKVRCKTIVNTDLGNSYSQMVAYMKANGKMDSWMALENLFYQLEKPTLETFIREKDTEKVNLYLLQLEMYMKAIGAKIRCKVKVDIHTLMEKSSREIMLKEHLMVSEY